MPTTTSLTTTYAGELAGEIVAKALQKVLTRKIADQKKTHSSDFECVFLCPPKAGKYR